MSMIYGRPELTLLVLLLVPAPFIGSLQSVPEAKLLADKRFTAHAGGLFTGGVLLLVCQLVLASMGLGARTFPIALVVSVGARVAVFWVLGNPGCSLRPRVGRWKYMLGDATRLVGTRLADWFSVNAPPLVLGLYFQDAVVGVFAYATNMSAQAIRVMAVSLSTILFAALAGRAREPERQRSAFLRSIGVLSVFAVPMCFLQAALAEPVLTNALKIEEWPGLVPAFQMLSVAMGFRLMMHPSRGYLLAQGRFGAAMWLSLVSGLLYFIGAVVSARFGLLALAGTQSVLHVLTSSVWFGVSLNRSRDGVRRGVMRLAPVFVSGAIGFGSACALGGLWYGGGLVTDVSVGLVSAIVGSVVFVALCIAMRSEALDATAGWMVEHAPGRIGGRLENVLRAARIRRSAG